MDQSSEKWDVIVVGGGPAGMMAAGRAAEKGARVLLLEKNDSLGKKLLITGGGRCNVTNAEFNDRILLEKFKDAGKFLFSAFSQRSVQESLDFFHDHNMPTKIENEKRVFPASNSAQSVWNVLVEYMQKGKVTVRSNSEVKGFKKTKAIDGNPQIESVLLKNGDTLSARSFILATGGKSRPETGSTGEGFEWLKKLGHIVIDTEAALVPITVEDAWVTKLQGITLPQVKITLFQNNQKQQIKEGKILFTHFGVSGPTILNMSKDIRELLQYGEVMLSLDILPRMDYGKLNLALQELFHDQAKKKVKNALGYLIPSALSETILAHAKIDPETFCHSISRDQRLDLVQTIKDIQMKVSGLLGVDKAVVTSGGLSLEEVDFRTMQSRIYPNLYIIGDVLNIDRPSGGYSLQLCWTTGWVAGTHAAN